MTNKDNSIRFFTNKVILSEWNGEDNLIAKFVLCSFEVNKNGVALDRETIETWMGTIINQPLVGRIIKGDFTSHNPKIVKNDLGENELIFDTEAFGTFTDVAVENIDGKDMLVATAEVWSRNPNVCRLIIKRSEMGTLNTSWEICAINTSVISGTKIIHTGKFIGHCLLSKNTVPAYDCSKLLEVADADIDQEFNEAMMTDIAAQNEMKVGEQKMKEKDVVTSMEDVEVIIPEIVEKNKEEDIAPVVSEESKKDEVPEEDIAPEDDDDVEDDIEESKCGDDKDKEKSEAETASLTEWDLREKLSRACAMKLNTDWAWVSWLFPAESKCWVHPYNANELDFAEFTYVVNGDEVEVSDPVMITLIASPRDMSAKLLNMSTALTAANEKLQSLETEVSGLAEYKVAYDQAQAAKAAAEHAEKEAELSAYAIKSGRITSDEITSDETIKTLVAELNWDGVKMLIADRFMASLQDSNAATAGNEDKIVVRASIEDEVPLKAKDCVNAWLNSKKKK